MESLPAVVRVTFTVKDLNVTGNENSGAKLSSGSERSPDTERRDNKPHKKASAAAWRIFQGTEEGLGENSLHNTHCLSPYRT